MQQTVDVAVKETKDLDLETIPAYGLFYFCSAAADAATDLAATTTALDYPSVILLWRIWKRIQQRLWLWQWIRRWLLLIFPKKFRLV